MLNYSLQNGFTTTSEKRNKSLFLFRSSAVGAKPRRGFTLIETFVATAVLLVSLAGPLSIAAQALRSSYYARDQVTAFYLAQEGLEYVRAKRDQNYLANPANPWLTGISDCVSPAVCTIDFPNFTHTVCTGSPVVCPALLLNDTTRLFNTVSGTPSIFTRKLTILPIAGTSDEVEVTVTVSWVSAGINRSFDISEHIFDWL